MTTDEKGHRAVKMTMAAIVSSLEIGREGEKGKKERGAIDRFISSRYREYNVERVANCE